MIISLFTLRYLDNFLRHWGGKGVSQTMTLYFYCSSFRHATLFIDLRWLLAYRPSFLKKQRVMGMGRGTENYSWRLLIVVLLLCLIYLDVWDLFIYLLLIIYSTLVFILSVLLSISPSIWFVRALHMSSIGVVVHHSSRFVIRISEFYVSLFLPVLGVLLIIFLVNIIQVEDSFSFCFWVIPLLLYWCMMLSVGRNPGG